MSQREHILKCPGCQHMILVDKLDEHVKSSHQTGLYEAPLNPMTGKRPIMGLPWYKQILVFVQDYPQGFFMWSIILILLTAILLWGKI